ncbi:spermatogenesis-associated protein 13-like [Limulus polyphemus]|uniref:Spermatogenesis-associated protein 13-like n=1 Tax=Limulus polyphemus TaxID=6850 RepID=A0ABM1T885_LIMPO|nr:spermatogenesis-associated protein 13-like [Limulus polyphemus]
MGIESNHTGPDVDSLGTEIANPGQPISNTAPTPGNRRVYRTQLTKNNLISKSERQLKTCSIPQFEAHSSEDVRRGGSSHYRPWSHIYSKAETKQILNSSFNVTDNTSSDKKLSKSSGNFSQLGAANSEKYATAVFNRHSSIRTSSPRSATSDSVLQKFRKTFSLRFQKNKKDTYTTGIYSTNAGKNKSFDESLSRTAFFEESDTDSLSQYVVSGLCFNPESFRKSPQNIGCKNQYEKGGSLVLRSSREKTGRHRHDRHSLRVSSVCCPDSSRQLKPEVSVTQTANSTMLSMPKTPSNSSSDVEEPSQDKDKPVELKILSLKNVQHRWSLEVDHNQILHSPTKASVKRQFSTPHPVKSRPVKAKPQVLRHKPREYLRRSFSQPLDIQRTAEARKTRASSRGLSDREGSFDGSTASSEEAFSDGEGCRVLPVSKTENSIKLLYKGTVTYAEALWDHVTMDPEELGFQAGEVIEVSDSFDKDWWWGSISNRSGWFPATFVRLRVNQEDTLEDCMDKLATGNVATDPRSKISVSLLSKEQVRANVVHEVIGTEKDFVKHLQDVLQGYLRQVYRRPDMFSPARIATIFGNIEEIYKFQRKFLRKLEECIDHNKPHLSLVGNCFLQHKTEFRIYSDYCNNHPLAVSELQELYSDSRYCHFFEACRLLQRMIDISLDGFLLTPVQRICKYPLQLAELLKYTDLDHPDYIPVTCALSAMKEVAQLVNERKRRMECLEQLVEWQQNIDGWEGSDVLDSCSVLIHSGDIIRAFSGWSREYTLFLFDNLLVYCKKDLLKRQNYVYKGRVHLDSCCIFNIEDGKDVHFGVTVKNAWKIYCASRNKWFLFYTKSPEEKTKWLEAFGEERQRVIEDEKQGFVVTERAKKAARLAVVKKQKAKHPRVKQLKGPRPHPDVAVTELLLDSPVTVNSRTGSLPSNFHPSMMKVIGGRQSPKKKGSGWFHFGSGKKTKK